MNSEVCSKGVEIGFRDGACSVCTGYRLHPSAHTVPSLYREPEERERESRVVIRERERKRRRNGVRGRREGVG